MLNIHDWAAAVKGLRQRLGLSQFGLAQRWFPLSVRTIQDWERGALHPLAS